MRKRNRRILSCRSFATVALIGGFALAQGSWAPQSIKQSETLFSLDERSQIVQYWGAPARYVIGPALSASTRGPWQVRLTPDGSTWLWSLTRGHKTAASLTATSLVPPALPMQVHLPTSLLERTSPPIHPAPPVRSVARVTQSGLSSPGNWDGWIAKRIRHDRWKALEVARTANSAEVGPGIPSADRDTPEVEPENPGPCPSDLLNAFGQPPVFAQAVQPKSYAIQFEDSNIQYEDNVRLGSPKYAYYRFSEGVMSGGVPLKRIEPERLKEILDLSGCDETKAHVMKAVSPLEGGFDSVNTYDTGFVSVGFIQFASLREGGGSLGAVLLNYKNASPESFNADFHRFGIDVEPSGLLDVVDPISGEEVSGPMANSRIIQDKRLIAVFQRAGQLSPQFCAAQVRTALAQYYPDGDTLSFRNSDGVSFQCRVCDLVHSEAGMAILFDRKVNTGNISLLSRQASLVASSHHCQTVSDLTKYEKEIVAGLKYRADFTQDSSLTQPSGQRR